jgi:hypothetical protein
MLHTYYHVQLSAEFVDRCRASSASKMTNNLLAAMYDKSYLYKVICKK